MTNYSEKGVVANHVSTTKNNNLSITYDGLLYKNGADTVFAHYGYGSKWTNKDTIAMKKTAKGFKVDIPLLKTGTVNIAFKDSSENWDNNEGSDYSFRLTAKKE